MFKLYKKFVLCFVLVILSVSSLLPANSLASGIQYESDLKVHYIDVGQADCILVELPNGQKMLIDSGNNEDEALIKKYLAAKSVKVLDYFITSHPHEDHIGCADVIISNYSTGSIYAPKISNNTKTFEDYLSAVKKKGLKIKTPDPGSYLINDKSKLSVQVLAPNSTGYDEINNYSLVLKLVYGSTSFLFTGDAEDISENEMIEGKYDLKADVLKVGHHGSKNSSTKAFLDKVKPKYSVISVGKENDYGHPSQDTLNRLSKINSQICRTDKTGTIIFTSNGAKITVDKNTSEIKENAPPVKSGSYIGNKNTKKFHRTTCSSLPDLKNRIYFKTREEATRAKYVPCKLCKP